MKQPSWESSPGALMAHLNSNKIATAFDLYEIRLQNGTILRYTNCDIPLTVSGRTYSVGPLITRSRTKQVVGVEVDVMDLNIVGDATVQVGGIGIIAAIALGLFSGATVLVHTVFLGNNTLSPIGTVAMFFGRVGQVVTGRGRAFMQIRSHSELLDILIPSEVYQPACKNSVYDASCKVSKASFRYAATVAVASGPGRIVIETGTINVNAVRAALNRFNTAVLVITSGQNANILRTIRTHTQNGVNEVFTLLTPTPYEILAGATVKIFDACNKKLSQCEERFNNRVNFRGEPFIPSPESIL